MKLLDYLQLTAEEFQKLLDDGIIDVAHHDEFPLSMFTYSRKAVAEHVWSAPVRKCRGLIIRDDTDEIIARPFDEVLQSADVRHARD